MSVVYMREMWGSTSGDFAGTDSSRRTRKWRVRTDNKWDTADSIVDYGMTSGILPQRFDVYPYNNALFAKSISCDGQDDSPLHWIVTVTYDAAPVDNIDLEAQEFPDPVDRRAKINWHTQLYREAIAEDRHGKATLNSAGDYPDPPVERDRSNWTATVVKNVRAIPAWFLDYNDCPINESAFTLDGVQVLAKTCRLTTIEIGEAQKESGYDFRQMRMELECRKDGWLQKRLDQGFREKKQVRTEGPNGGYVYVDRQVQIQVQDDNGSMTNITSPALLDGNGKRLEDPTPANAVYIPDDLYEPKNFSILPLA